MSQTCLAWKLNIRSVVGPERKIYLCLIWQDETDHWTSFTTQHVVTCGLGQIHYRFFFGQFISQHLSTCKNKGILKHNIQYVSCSSGEHGACGRREDAWNTSMSAEKDLSTLVITNDKSPWLSCENRIYDFSHPTWAAVKLHCLSLERAAADL